MVQVPKVIAFHNLTLVDPNLPNPIPNTVILVEGNRIQELGKAEDFGTRLDQLECFDLEGRFVLPGLINAHDHLTWRRAHGSFEERVVRQPPARLLARGVGHALVSLLEGVTTVRDMGSRDGLAIILRDTINAGEVQGPRILAAGLPIAMTGGHIADAVSVADGPTEIRKAVRQQIKNGADFIKLMASGGYADQPIRQQFTKEEMHAAFDEAHRAGKPTTVHVHPPEAICAAIEAGVDCIEHAAFIDQATAELVAEREIFVVPTLSDLRMEISHGERMGRQQWYLERYIDGEPRQRHMFRMLLEAGCKIVSGVDSLGDLQGELSFMVEYGMDPRRAIAAATVAAAACLGIEDRVGTIESGKLADFIAVDGNPLEDIQALRRVALTVKDGAIYRAEYLRSTIGPSLVTEFRN